jgi:penicillin amidase
MDFHRRLGAGRLAEVAGKASLPLDRYMRTLGLYALAEAQYAALPPAPRAAVDAYTAGVNAFLKAHSGAWPVEFLALRYTPEPWRPADSLVWGRMMAVFLSRNWREEALAGALLKRLTPEQVNLLLPPYPADAPVTLAAAPNPLSFGSASNWWVLSGRRTTSGKPLLANDPHLRLRAPSLWYLAHVEAPGWSMTGATVPGVPFHVLGHNGRIAWGFTSAETDVEDLFIERVDPADPSSYITPDGPRPFETRRETIRVKGAADVPHVVRRTRHGPVISDLRPELAGLLDKGEVLALSSAALLPDDSSAAALHALNRAGNWAAFHAALAGWHSPHLNVAYADTAGHTGMIAPGRVPVRRHGDGSAPAPGWNGRFDWTGFVPYDALPQVLDPPADRLVNANNPVVGASYPHHMGRLRSAGFRARRIEARLAARELHDAASMTDIQRDAVSEAARTLLPLMTAIVPSGGTQTLVLDALKAWDGSMGHGRPEPIVFLKWMEESIHNIFADELGPLFPRWRGLKAESLRRVLASEKAWCDNVNTPASETCINQLTLAFQSTIDKLRYTYSNRPDGWRWGSVHYAQLDHPVLGRIPLVGRIFGMRPAISGGPFTIYRARPDMEDAEDPFAAIHGPGFRAVYDLAGLASSRFIVSTGQSGHVLSPHYRDQTPRWVRNYLLAIAPDAGEQRLHLVPR